MKKCIYKSLLLVLPLFYIGCSDEGEDIFLEQQSIPNIDSDKTRTTEEDFSFELSSYYELGDYEIPTFNYPDYMNGMRVYIVGLRNQYSPEPDIKIDDKGNFDYDRCGSTLVFDGRLGDSNPSIYFTIPGYWIFKAFAVDDKHQIDKHHITKIESSTMTVEVPFPSSNTILAQLSDSFEDIWEKTLEEANEQGRKEFGVWCYVTASTSGLSYHIGNVETGKNVTCGDGASMSVPPILEEKWPKHIQTGEIGCYAVAFFHTHTPLTYCSPSISRKTGPSETDIQASESLGIPILVCDYSDPNIRGGHELNMAHIVTTCSLDSRRFDADPIRLRNKYVIIEK